MTEDPCNGFPADTAQPEVLDYTGLLCPLPVLRARKALKGFPQGAHVIVLSDDPAAPKDFAAFCEVTGHVLLETVPRGDGNAIRIRTRGPGSS